MNRISDNHETSLPHVEDVRTERSVLNREEPIERSTRVVSKANRLVTKITILVLSLLTLGAVTKPAIIEFMEWVWPPTLQIANNTLPVINTVKVSSGSTAFTRTTRRRHQSIAQTAYSRPSRTIESSPKIIVPFHLPIGTPVTFSEDSGVVRARELPTIATIPSSWGNGLAR